jgi:arylsulfatase A-like enzyme
MHELVHQADLTATFADILQFQLGEDAAEDSFSFLPLLKGAQSPVRPFAINMSSNGLLSLRRGTWKLIFGPGSGGWGKGSDEHAAQLYNLAGDLEETQNLFARRPELVADLTAAMEELVNKGRSTPGKPRANDVPVNWKQFLKP